MITKKNTFNILLIFLTLHTIVWTLIPSLSNLNLPLDTIEALAWGSNLDWGYNKHPPMSAFVVEIFYTIFGSQDWAFYFLSQLFVVLSFFYVWKLSNIFLKNKIFSLLSVLILASVVFFNYTTPEFNVYVCQLPFRIMTIYYCWKSISDKKLFDLILFGVFAALGFLTHYSFIFLLIGLTFYYLYLIFKYQKIKINYLVPFLIFLIFLVPHLLWLNENKFITIFYALNRTGIDEINFIKHFLNPLVFLFKQLVVLIPLIITFFLIFEKNKKKSKINFRDEKFLFLICTNLIPIIIILIVSILTGAKIRTMWMSTFYLSLGIFVFYIFENKIKLKNINRFVFTIIFFFILSPSIYLYVSLSNDFKRTDYPGKEIARLVQNKWENNFSNKISYVIGDEWFAGNLSYHLRSRPIWIYNLEDKASLIKENQGVIYTGNPKILKKVCPGVFGTIKPVGYCMIGNK